jgi:hypothetical protein
MRSREDPLVEEQEAEFDAANRWNLRDEDYIFQLRNIRTCL